LAIRAQASALFFALFRLRSALGSIISFSQGEPSLDPLVFYKPHFSPILAQTVLMAPLSALIFRSAVEKWVEKRVFGGRFFSTRRSDIVFDFAFLYCNYQVQRVL
jgi:hypothetical protein